MSGEAVPQRADPRPHPADLEAVAAKVIAVTGLEYYADKRNALAGHVARLAAENGLDAPECARRLLQPAAGPLFDRLVDEVTIGETYFFRYPQQDAALRDSIVPACLERRRRERRLTVWSAGCASGAEPYSLAILLHSQFGRELAGWRVSILATDINRRALDRARDGVFSDWELRTAGDAERRRHFTACGKGWRIRPQYRQWVEFRHQNLKTQMDAFAAASRGAFDIILCRNVLIYFAPELIRRFVRNALFCLADEGWLLVGHAEPHFEIATSFTPVLLAGVTAYAKGVGAPAQAAAPAADPRPVGFQQIPAVAAPDPPPGPVAAPKPDVADTIAPRAEGCPSGQPDPEAELAAIRACADGGDWAAAKAACEEFVNRRPLAPSGYLTLALIAEHQGLQEEAEQALRRALYLDRTLALAHYHLGRCLLHRGARPAAARAFTNALRAVAGADDKALVALGEGLTVAELRDLVSFHIGLTERLPA